MTHDAAYQREPPPPAGSLDVWRASLDPVLPSASNLAVYLAPAESARAARFVSSADQDRFVVGRAFVRLLLARYLGVHPHDVRLRQGPHGKPLLASGSIAFNLAHSGGLAVCAIASADTEVGVDVERLRPMDDLSGVMRMILSPRERENVDALTAPRRLRRLYEIWTCKEAVLKAIGSGLDRPLDAIEVVFARGAHPQVLVRADDARAPARFAVQLFEPAPGYVGAAATEGQLERIRHLEWRWDRPVTRGGALELLM